MALQPSQYPCTKCPAHYETKEEQAEHLRTDHGSTTPWLCHECATSCVDEAELNTHMSSVHPNNRQELAMRYRCVRIGCGKPLASSDQILRHMKHDHIEQAGRELRRCTRKNCGFQNESYVGMSLHSLHEHRPKCEKCEKVFLNVVELIDHRNGKDKDGPCPAAEDKVVDEGVPGISNPPKAMNRPRPDRMELLPPSCTTVIGGPRGVSFGEATAAVQTGSSSTPLGITVTEEDTALRTSLKPAANEPSDDRPGSKQSSQPIVIADDSIRERSGGFQSPKRLPTAEPQQPTVVQQPELPASIATHGFTGRDFDPATVYSSHQANKNMYRDFPPDLPLDLIFRADPKLIAYGNLLRLATKFSNAEIRRRANEGRPEEVFKSSQTVDSRVRAAIKSAADAWGPGWTVDAVETWLDNQRKSNGMVVRAKKRAHADEPAVLEPRSEQDTRPMVTPKRARTDETSPTPPLAPTHKQPGMPEARGELYHHPWTPDSANGYAQEAGEGTGAGLTSLLWPTPAALGLSTPRSEFPTLAQLADMALRDVEEAKSDLHPGQEQ